MERKNGCKWEEGGERRRNVALLRIQNVTQNVIMQKIKSHLMKSTLKRHHWLDATMRSKTTGYPNNFWMENMKFSKIEFWNFGQKNNQIEGRFALLSQNVNNFSRIFLLFGDLGYSKLVGTHCSWVSVQNEIPLSHF